MFNVLSSLQITCSLDWDLSMHFIKRSLEIVIQKSQLNVVNLDFFYLAWKLKDVQFMHYSNLKLGGYTGY